MTELTGPVVWMVVIGVGIVTYALRASFVFGYEYLGEFPPVIDRLLPFFPIGILSALVVPGLLFVDGSLVVGATNPRLIAGLVAFAVAWYTDSILATVGTGMVTLWALLWLPVP